MQRLYAEWEEEREERRKKGRNGRRKEGRRKRREEDRLKTFTKVKQKKAKIK
jgi:hypothetical protein